jgi:beta-lactamase regulating signal transducer with metallopeptidase domain
MSRLLEIGLINAAMAALLALVVAGVVRLVRRPAVAHRLWLLVLLKLLAPPLVVLPLLWLPALGAGGPQRASRLFWTDAGGDAGPAAAVTAPGDAPRRGLGLVLGLGGGWTLAGWLWAAGSGLWLVHVSGRIVRFRSFLRAAEPAPDDVQRRADALAGRLGLAERPGVWMVPCTVSPQVWALGGGTRVLLPQALWEELDDEQRATLLVHELAHIGRRDHWVRLVEVAVTVLYWWHPVVWWARGALREAEEQCCDAWVVETLPAAVRSYASALLATLRFLSATSEAESEPATASAMGQFHDLRKRLLLITRGQTARRMPPAGACVVVAAAALLLPLSLVAVRPRAAVPVPASPLAGPSQTRAAALAAGALEDDPLAEIEELARQVDLKRAELLEVQARLIRARGRLKHLDARLDVPAQLAGYRDLGAVPPGFRRPGPAAGPDVLAGPWRHGPRAVEGFVTLDLAPPPETSRRVSQHRLRELDRKLDTLLDELKSLKHPGAPRD